MSAVLERSELERSPLADLHSIANEVGVDGYRRLRKADLVDAILAQQGGESKPRSRRSSSTNGRTSSTRTRRGKVDTDEQLDSDERSEKIDSADDADDQDSRGRRTRRGGRSRTRARSTTQSDEQTSDRSKESSVDGVVEILANGSGFVRVSSPDTSNDDVYISAAQIKRCDIVAGDRVTGPVRQPRRSERYPSLVRVESVNGKSTEELADRARYEDLAAVFPTERLTFSSQDVTVKAIEWLTPIGKGSRVSIVGSGQAGKSETLRRLAAGLIGQDGLTTTVILAGVRPEELSAWSDLSVTVSATSSLGSSVETQTQAIETAVEQGRRVAARGGDAVVLIDSLECPPTTARRILASAKKIADGGSLTIIATALEPVGGETTVIVLDPTLTGLRRFPALDLDRSGTMRPELLVGEVGADAIAKARAEALVP